MTTITLDKKAIQNGNRFVFENREGDNWDSAEIDQNDKGEFRILFNGAFIWIGKFFPALQKRFDTLCEKWNLTPNLNDE